MLLKKMQQPCGSLAVHSLNKLRSFSVALEHKVFDCWWTQSKQLTGKQLGVKYPVQSSKSGFSDTLITPTLLLTPFQRISWRNLFFHASFHRSFVTLFTLLLKKKLLLLKACTNTAVRKGCCWLLTHAACYCVQTHVIYRWCINSPP